MLADHHGNVVHLGERECSIQRRHQKLVEDSTALTDGASWWTRQGPCSPGPSSSSWTPAGGSTSSRRTPPPGRARDHRDGDRHRHREGAGRNPQLGERLPFEQSELTFTGHAIECRVNAEDPETFVPSPGRPGGCAMPGGPGVRNRHGGPLGLRRRKCTLLRFADRQGDGLRPRRQEAMARMRRTLEMTVIEGIKTTVPLHLKIMNNPNLHHQPFPRPSWIE